MSWTMHRWVWRVVSPLHVGWLPAGAVSRTRLYVPARALWGAFTAELARRQNPANCQEPYAQKGQQLRQNVRFSYLFPAEQVGHEWLAWLPRYQQKEGLVWEREDRETLSDHSFRQRLLITQPGTAINPASDTAEEGTLRELELISPWWRSQENGHSPKPVAMVGYLFCRDPALCTQLPALCTQLQQVTELFIGGDTRYGLGRLQRQAFEPVSSFFLRMNMELSGEVPVVEGSLLLAHTYPQRFPAAGALECVRGWDTLNNTLSHAQCLWVPGSQLPGKSRFCIEAEGYWRIANIVKQGGESYIS